MNKLDMAHDYMVAWMQSGNSEIIDANELASFFFSVADAMQAEADKREPKGFPVAIKESGYQKPQERPFFKETNHSEPQPEVDWRLAPEWANYYKTDGKKSIWVTHDFEPVGDVMESTYPIGFFWNEAPSFGFTESHVMERPQ